jgi:hypothetical protein
LGFLGLLSLIEILKQALQTSLLAPMSQDFEDSFLAIWLFFAGTLEPVLPRALAETVYCVLKAIFIISHWPLEQYSIC